MPNATIANLLTDVTRQGGIDSNRYSSATIMRVFTIAAQSINTEVMRAMKDVDFQGERSLHDLVANQREYLNPNDLLKLKRVDLKLDGSNWKTADPFDASEVPDNLVAEADIIARFSNDNPKVDFMDESYFIYSGTISNVSGGIMLWYDKDIVGQNSSGSDITAFSASTDVPTLLPFASQAMVIWAIIDWYEGHPNAQKLAYWNRKLWGYKEGRPPEDKQIGGLMRQVINHYADRNPDRKIEMSNAYQEEDFN